MSKAIIRKDWFESVWLKWSQNPVDVEQTRGTHPFSGGYTEIFTGQHPEVMRDHPRYKEWIDMQKLKLSITTRPGEKAGHKNLSMSNNDLFDLKKCIGDEKPYIIYVDDMLEHISYRSVADLLVHWFDRMELGGEIQIRTPNLHQVAKAYLEGGMEYATAMQFMYGLQTYEENFHLCLFDEKALRVLLEEVGFSRIRIDAVDKGLFLNAWARKEKELTA